MKNRRYIRTLLAPLVIFAVVVFGLPGLPGFDLQLPESSGQTLNLDTDDSPDLYTARQTVTECYCPDGSGKPSALALPAAAQAPRFSGFARAPPHSGLV